MTAQWPPRIQVAGISSLEEALFAHSVGVHALGFTLGLPTGAHDGLTPAKAAHITSHLPDSSTVVLITYADAARKAHELISHIGAHAVQLHGGVTEKELVALRHLCPNTRTIGRVSITDASSVDHALSFQPPLWDAIILDSVDPRTKAVGATGLTHDWDISAEIVRQSSLPVILAGGLHPGNVADAIKKVLPAGVDAHTGLEHRNGARDFDKIKLFAKFATEAFSQANP